MVTHEVLNQSVPLVDHHAAELDVALLEGVERAALALQGSLLMRIAPQSVSDAFCTTPLAGDGGRACGTVPPGTDLAAILERAWPRA